MQVITLLKIKYNSNNEEFQSCSPVFKQLHWIMPKVGSCAKKAKRCAKSISSQNFRKNQHSPEKNVGAVVLKRVMFVLRYRYLVEISWICVGARKTEPENHKTVVFFCRVFLLLVSVLFCWHFKDWQPEAVQLWFLNCAWDQDDWS